MVKFLSATLFLLALAIDSGAQWKEDVSSNTQVTPNSLSFFDPEVLTNANGYTYVFFQVQLGEYDNRSMRLQIMEPDGKRQTRSGGYTISEEENVPWTKVNRTTMLDNNGNLVVAVFDQRNSADGKGFGYFIYKYNEKGERLFGPVPLNNGVATYAACGMYMCCLDDGSYMFVYGDGDMAQDWHINYEKMSPDGILAWDEPKTITGGKPQFPLMAKSKDNQAMILYVNNGAVYAKMIDADGKNVWAEDVVAYNGSFHSSKIWDVEVISEGPDGSVIFGTMDYDYNAMITMVKADGTHGFAEGAAGHMLNDPEYATDKPALCFNKQTGEFYAAYRQFTTDFMQQSVFAQKFSPEGQALWEGGRQVLPYQYGSQIQGQSVQVGTDGGISVFYQMMGDMSSVGTVGNYMVRMDSDGNTIGEPFNFATSATTKYELGTQPLVDGRYFLTYWLEKRAPSTCNCVFMQLVTADGNTSGISGAKTKYTGRACQHIFSADGTQRAETTKGLNIVRTETEDGNVKTEKIMVY